MILESILDEKGLLELLWNKDVQMINKGDMLTMIILFYTVGLLWLISYLRLLFTDIAYVQQPEDLKEKSKSKYCQKCKII